MNDQRCENCRFFVPYEDDGNPEYVEIEGWCYRYPPIFDADRSGGDEHGSLDIDNWMRPMVFALSSCGEWQPKEQSPE